MKFAIDDFFNLFQSQVRGIPDYDYEFGHLKFDRSIQAISDRFTDLNNTNTFDDFEGMPMKKTRK